MTENPEFQYDPDKNYDEEILQQVRSIEKEIATDKPLVSEKFTLETISHDYAKEDIVYQQKLQSLSDTYKYVRRTRGDGNCFYRAFGFAYFEYLTYNKENFSKFYELMVKSKDSLINLGFPAYTIEDFHENFMMLLDEVKNGCDANEVLRMFNDQGLSDYIIVYLRLLVSGHLQNKSEFYANFLEGDLTMQEFCNQEVEPMGRECDHIHIIAMTTALDVSVQIAYMDRGEGQKVVNHIFPADSTPNVLLLYRPGHYDIIYRQ